MPILRSAREKRDRSLGVTFGWRGGTSRWASSLGALLIVSCVFAFFSYTLRVTLADSPGKRPLASPLLRLDTASEVSLPLRDQHAATEKAILEHIDRRIDRLTRASADRPITPASLPRTFGPTRVTLPSLLRPGFTSLPLPQQTNAPAPVKDAALAPALVVQDFGNLADRISHPPAPLALPSADFAPQIGGSLTALITVSTDGSVLSHVVLSGETQGLIDRAELYTSRLTFTPGPAISEVIALAVVQP